MGKIKGGLQKLKKAKGRVVKTVRPGFWKKVLLTLHPKKYSELSTRTIRSGLKYLLSLLLASFIIMCILALPSVVSMPQYIESELSKFSKLNISIDTEMDSPVMIPEKDPQIVVDTTNTAKEMGNEKILITEDYAYYRPYGRTMRYNLSEFKDITAHKKETSKFLTFLAILLIPTVLITSYVIFLVKYILMIIVVALILFLAAKIARKNLSIFRSLNTALYASTPMILIEVIFIPFNSKYLIPVSQFMGTNIYLVTLLVYFSLAVFGPYFAMKPKKGKAKEEYPEIEGI